MEEGRGNRAGEVVVAENDLTEGGDTAEMGSGGGELAGEAEARDVD